MELPPVLKVARNVAPDEAQVLAKVRALDDAGRHSEAVELLKAEAKNGGPLATVELGERLLVGARGAPFAPEQGAGLIAIAADHGNPDGLARLAALTAAGAYVPQSWSGALELLSRAAEAGSIDARGQLQALATDRSAPGDWRRLADSIDVDAWLTPPSREPICETPRVRKVKGFVTREVCRWLISRARDRLKPAGVFDSETGASKLDRARTCSHHLFDFAGADLVVLLLRARIAALVQLPPQMMEPPQVLHYQPGQEFKPHYDNIRQDGGTYGGDYDGDRIVTFLLYLNDGYEGGELDFPRAGFRCKGGAGDAIYFALIDAAGAPDKLSLHAGLPVTKGEKWLFSQWIHDRALPIEGLAC